MGISSTTSKRDGAPHATRKPLAPSSKKPSASFLLKRIVYRLKKKKAAKPVLF
jgi:hypothetical protein